jgi:hypothetical protein
VTVELDNETEAAGFASITDARLADREEDMMSSTLQPETLRGYVTAGGLWKRLLRTRIAAALLLMALMGFGPGAGAQDELNPNYVETVNIGLSGTGPGNTTVLIPGIATWRTLVNIRGGGWPAGTIMDVSLRGPLNTLGVAPILRPLANEDANGVFTTDATGKFAGRIRIPYQNRADQATLPSDPDITRPGLYQIRVIRRGGSPFIALDVAVSHTFNVCPNTTTVSGLFEPLWYLNRGARDGWLGKESPERVDPEWVTVWSEQPVGLYATVAPSTLNGTRADGLHQGSHVTYDDYPATHFTHDWNLHLIPDFEYLWTMATEDFQGDAGENDTGRIEWEWELQNNGSPFVGSYGQGTVGVPLFVLPTVGDRIYTVGRWILDSGHPPASSEIHPPRMIATMRKRNTIVPFGGQACVTRAAEVDVYVSGHGGGANLATYGELERFLGNNGKGGARLQDFGIGTPLDPNGDLLGQTYQRFGPDVVFHGGIGTLIDFAEFIGAVPHVNALAGPSALGTPLAGGLPVLSSDPVIKNLWSHSSEFRPVNDMDYEFDVLLPPKPADATTPLVQVTRQPMDSTGVNEIITYSGLFAHVRLPYKGADNGIYARTLKFYWDTYSPPGNHFVVQIKDIATTRAFYPGPFSIGPQPLYLWADVCGQWRFLSEMNLGLLTPKSDGGVVTDPDHVSFDGFQGARFDVYLDDLGIDTLRVFVGGYAQRDLDGLFGDAPSGVPLYNMNAYDAGVAVAEAVVFGSGDNQELGGAVYDSGAQTAVDASPVTVAGQSATITGDTGVTPLLPCLDPVMKMTFSAIFVPRPARILVSPSQLSFTSNCGSISNQQLQITNAGDAQTPLVVSGLTFSAAGFSLVSPPALPLTLAPGASQTLTVHFSPTVSGAITGTLAISSNDPCDSGHAVPLSATVSGLSPSISATAATTRTPSLVIGAVTTWPLTIANTAPTGACDMSVHPSIQGTGGTWGILLPLRSNILDQVVPAGGTNTNLTVGFKATVLTTKAVGVLTLSTNDLAHPTTRLTFGAEVVPVGMRVLVVRADGTPYPVVDEIKLKNESKKVNAHLKDAPLTIIDPPASWSRIQYHYMTTLPPTDDASTYELQVKVGNRKQTVTFSLAADEFKQLVVTFP